MIQIDSILDVEKYIDDVDVVVFDLDDTLYSEKEYVRSGYHKIAEHLLKPELEEQMWNVFKSGGMAIDEVLKANNLIEMKKEALQVYRYQEPDIHLYEGVSEMLINIRKEKKVGIITDGRPEGQKAKLTSLGICVDKIIITDELGGISFRKPNKRAFCLMKEFFNVAFERMAYVGDNLKKDFIAPQHLGMKCIWFKNTDGLYVQME